jgi:pimeloyl-ACP methyl ester carboxylesterase
MPRKTPAPRPVPATSQQPPLISARWLGLSVGLTIVAAAFCAWAALCLLFWQGSWQLLYHPAAVITRTPSAAVLSFESVAFDPDNAGQAQLSAWWIPQSPLSGRTALYLHGADGNLSNTIDTLALLHSAGLNVFAIDYRGYGQSRQAHPSETSLRQDADAAIAYLTATRHIPAEAIVLIGTGLGANLALEVAAAHSELAGVVLDQPLAAPMQSVFGDARARLVPAHALVHDRYDLTAASDLRIPTLWVETETGSTQQAPDPYTQIPSRKMLVWLPSGPIQNQTFLAPLTRWLDSLGQ